MGKASSAKKVARAARAGGRGSRGGQRRSLLFPATITVVCVLGVSLILYARTQDEAQALEPGVTDHWHAAYAIDICGSIQPPLTNDADPNGTHTHGDGVIHIHPFSSGGAGENATLGAFLDGAGIKLTDTQLTVGDQTTTTAPGAATTAPGDTTATTAPADPNATTAPTTAPGG